ncbi:MAG: hypothetical protein U0491_03080 [Candidatus Saccharimonadales bacterium]
MASEPLILTVELDGEQKIYSLYKGITRKLTIACSSDNNIVQAKIDFGGERRVEELSDSTEGVIYVVEKVLKDYGYATQESPISGIGIKVAAPGSRFLTHEFISSERLKALKDTQQFSEGAIQFIVHEVQQIQKVFAGVPIFGVSDTAYHAHKSDAAWNYDINLTVADRYEIKRFGYNGLSNESAIQILGRHRVLEQKVIICHLGKNYSVTAIMNGKSINTSTGISPQEGVLSAYVSSDISLSALKTIALKTNTSLDVVIEEQCLNGGIQGVAGTNDTISALLIKEKKGDYRAKLALEMLVESIQKHIAHMVIELGGVDQLVFTGEDGIMLPTLRKRIVEKLDFLGLAIDSTKNKLKSAPEIPAKIHQRTRVKSIYVVTTDESLEIAWRTRKALTRG